MERVRLRRVAAVGRSPCWLLFTSACEEKQKIIQVGRDHGREGGKRGSHMMGKERTKKVKSRLGRDALGVEAWADGLGRDHVGLAGPVQQQRHKRIAGQLGLAVLHVLGKDEAGLEGKLKETSIHGIK